MLTWYMKATVTIAMRRGYGI